MCDFPKCREFPVITYIGKELCGKHWAQLSNLEGEKEQKMLNKIGLLRSKEGKVLRITPKRIEELNDVDS